MQPYNRTTTDNSAAASDRTASSPQSGALLQSPYGCRSFNNNEEARTFINTALNAGTGHIGAVATARNLSIQPESGRRALSAFVSREERVSGTGLSAIGRPVSLHGPRSMPLLNHLSNVPLPSSAMLLLANVDTPIRSEAAGENPRTNTNNGPPPPLPPPVNSVRSISSIGSGLSDAISCSSSSSSSCRCSTCKPPGCVCYMYCSHHARRRCPVHGEGINSSDESDLPWSSSDASLSLYDGFRRGGRQRSRPSESSFVVTVGQVSGKPWPFM